jgi:hypothetical protein
MPPGTGFYYDLPDLWCVLIKTRQLKLFPILSKKTTFIFRRDIQSGTRTTTSAAAATFGFLNSSWFQSSPNNMNIKCSENRNT